MPRSVLRIAVIPLLVLGVLAGSGCGPKSSQGCGPILREALDRQYLVHVLPGAPEPTYLSDPPTSGAHQPAPPYTGVLHQSLSRPVQVGILEAGKVLIQYRGLSAKDQATLEALGGAKVVVAPNPDLKKSDPIVATAWQAKRTCTAVNTAALREFITAREDQAPGNK